jgi:hypothetical protein
MRKFGLLLAVLLAASLSTSADAAKRKAAKPDPAIAAQQNTAKFIRDASNPAMAKPAAVAKPAKKAKKKKSKRSR